MQFGIVDAVHMGADGYFATVIVNDGHPVTAHVGASYAGSNYGVHCPLEVGSLVAVSFQDGCEPVVVARLFSQEYTPPARAQSKPEDLVIDVKPKQNLYLRVSKGAHVYLVSEDGGKVKVGGEEDLEPGVLGRTLKSYLDQVKTWMDSLKTAFAAHTHPYLNQAAPAVTSATTSPAPEPPAVPDILAKIAEVK
jgi:predicted RNA binding protein YcfA (HicA-like mRNA interferase family)